MRRLLLAFLLLPAWALPAAAQAPAAPPSQVETPQAPLRFSKHALSRMDERGISPRQVRQAIEKGEKFRYYHQDRWKTGYFDPDARLFVAADGGVVITVFKDATRAYVERLKRKSPR